MSVAPEPEPFVVEKDAVPVVVVAQEVDFANAAAFAAAIELAGETAGSDGAVVVDFLQCSFMDSSGLQVLLRAQRAGLHLGVTCAPESPVARLLDLAAGGLVETYESRSAAQAALSETRAA